MCMAPIVRALLEIWRRGIWEFLLKTFLACFQAWVPSRLFVLWARCPICDPRKKLCIWPKLLIPTQWRKEAKCWLFRVTWVWCCIFLFLGCLKGRLHLSCCNWLGLSGSSLFKKVTTALFSFAFPRWKLEYSSFML